MAALRIISDIKHRAAGAGLSAMQPVDAAAERKNLIEQPEVGKHGQAGRLQD